MRLLPVAAVAVLLAAAHPSVSCDKEAKAGKSHADCATKCPHAAATTASAGKTGDAVPAVNQAGHAGCPHAARNADLKAEKAGGGCPHAAKTTTLAATGARTAGPSRDLRATGKVVCMRCDLKKAEACQSVFQQAGGTGTYPLCNEALTDELLKLTRHGELDVTVHGRVSRSDTGQDVLCVDGFSVGTI